MIHQSRQMFCLDDLPLEALRELHTLAATSSDLQILPPGVLSEPGKARTVILGTVVGMAMVIGVCERWSVRTDIQIMNQGKPTATFSMEVVKEAIGNNTLSTLMPAFTQQSPTAAALKPANAQQPATAAASKPANAKSAPIGKNTAPAKAGAGKPGR